MTVLYLSSVAAHLALSAAMSGPVIQTDEGAYIGAATQLVRGTGLLYRQSPFQAGYGVLLAPVAWFTTNPTAIYRGAIVLNALAIGALAPLVFRAGRFFFGRRAIGKRIALALVTAAYPPYLAYSNVALEVSVFVPLCVATLLAVAAATERPSWWRWAVAGALAGGCYGLHLLGVAVVLATLAAAVLAGGPTRRRMVWAVAVLGGMQVTVLGTVWLLRRTVAYDRHLARAIGAPVVTRSQAVAGLYSHNAHVHGHAALLLTEAAGQVWYLIAASAGIVVIGAGAAVAGLWRVVARGSRNPADVAAGFAGLLAAAGLYSSANRFIVPAAGTGQADTLIYGRYVEHVVAPLLIVGAAHVLRLVWRNVPGWLAAIGASVAVCGLVLGTQRTAGALRAPIVFVNVLGLHPILHALGRVDVVQISLVAVAAGAAVLVLGAARWWVAAAVLAVAGMASGLYSANAMVADSRTRTHQRVVLHALSIVDRVAGVQRCVGYDIAVGNNWTFANDQTFRPATLFEPVQSSARTPTCGPVIATSRDDLDTSYPGARLMALENDDPVLLWVLPGPVQDRLSAAGALLPAGFPVQLPADAFHARIDALTAPAHVLPGQRFTVTVTVTNVGTGSPWPSRYGFTAGDGWVSAAFGLAPAGEAAGEAAGGAAGGAAGAQVPDALLHGDRAWLARELWPGESDTETLTLTASANGRPLAPGRYDVVIGMVQEGMKYFVQIGDDPTRIPIQVS